MLMLASILAIFVYGMIAATLGTILPDLSGAFRTHTLDRTARSLSRKRSD